MKKLVVLVLLALVVLPVAGTAFWSWSQGLHPIKHTRDYLTGFQADHPRHDFPQSQAVHWDPMGDHNAAVAALAPDDRAYSLIAEAVARLRTMHGQEDGSAGVLPGFVRARAGDPEWPQLTAWLGDAAVREVIALIGEATRRPVLGAPLSVRDDPEWVAVMAAHGVEMPADPTPAPARPLMLGALMPPIAAIRDLGRVCDARARVAVERGDAEAFVGAMEDVLGLASLVSEPGFLIDRLVRVAMLMTAVDRVGATLVHHPDLIDDAAAAGLEGFLSDAVAAGWTAIDPTTELVVFEDVIRRMVDHRGVFDPTLVQAVMSALDDPAAFSAPPASTAPLAAFHPDLLASYREAERYAAAGVEATRAPFRPYAITQEEMDAWSTRRDSIPGRIGRLLLGILTPKWSGAAKTFRAVDQYAVGLRVALAAHRHHLRHGEPPASLDAIDPDLIDFDPVDGFTGGRLVYRWTGEGHLIYALGADGDDDAGRHVLDPDGAPLPFISDEYLVERWDGDFVVFPPRE